MTSQMGAKYAIEEIPADLKSRRLPSTATLLLETVAETERRR